MQVLVAPAGFDGSRRGAIVSRRLRATEVAAAIGRGLEAAGLEPPDVCPVADGGPGTLEVLLTRLGGDSLTANVGGPDGPGPGVDVGFGLIGDGSAAIVELAAIPSDPGDPSPAVGDPGSAVGVGRFANSWAVGELIVAGAQTGADVVLVAGSGVIIEDGGSGLVAAIEAAGGLGRTRVVVLCPVRPHLAATQPGHGGEPAGVGEILGRAFGATVEPGAAFVLDAVGFDPRMRAARAVIVGEGDLDVGALGGRVFGEAATRARQAGVPCHAIVGVNRLDPFDARILDVQEILEGPTLAALTAAAERLAARL